MAFSYFVLSAQVECSSYIYMRTEDEEAEQWWKMWFREREKTFSLSLSISPLMSSGKKALVGEMNAADVMTISVSISVYKNVNKTHNNKILQNVNFVWHGKWMTHAVRERKLRVAKNIIFSCFFVLEILGIFQRSREENRAKLIWFFFCFYYDTHPVNPEQHWLSYGLWHNRDGFGVYVLHANKKKNTKMFVNSAWNIYWGKTIGTKSACRLTDLIFFFSTFVCALQSTSEIISCEQHALPLNVSIAIFLYCICVYVCVYASVYFRCFFFFYSSVPPKQ